MAMSEVLSAEGRESAKTVLDNLISRRERETKQLQKLKELVSTPGFDPELESFIWSLLMEYRSGRGRGLI